VGCRSGGPGTVWAADITADGASACWTFDRRPGALLRLVSFATPHGSPVEPVIEVVRPDGTTVCGPSADDVQYCQIDEWGTHAQLARDRLGTNTGGFAISVEE
jgi:hypothetical protein